MSEYNEQCCVMDWAEAMTPRYPELALLNSSANGVRVPIGLAVKMKKAGLKKGYPDLFLPVPRGKFHGLYVEQKIKGGRQSEEQKWWEARLRQLGYAYFLCWDSRATCEVIEGYLKGDMK